MKTLLTALLLCPIACSQPAPAQSVDVQAQLAEIQERLADKDARIEALEKQLKVAQQAPSEVAPYVVELPRWPLLGGLYRPMGVDAYPTTDEICFEAKPAAQWFSALNRALGGKR